MPTDIETNDESFDDFFDAFDAEHDHQSEAEDNKNEVDAAAEEPTQENTPDGGDDGEGGASEEPSTEPTTDGDPTAQSQPAPEKFTIRVNHSDMEVTREQMIEYAQKGADYDRVKAQLEQGKSDNQALRSQLDATQEVYDLIAGLAKDSGMEIPALLDQFRVTQYRAQGLSEDAAKERLSRVKTERELEQLKGKQTTQKTEEEARQERIDRESAEFAQKFPDAKLSEEIARKLAPDVQSGMSLSDAYQKMLDAEKDAQIRQLKAELEAERQNKANHASSPGSMKDVGSKKNKDSFDDFFDAFD